MRPTIDPGDWLLVDPTSRRWPRRGTIVVFREPGTELLAIKRVAGRPGDWVPFADGWLELADDEAWLASDAGDAALEAAGHGQAIDSRHYGPVPVDANAAALALADSLAKLRDVACEGVLVDVYDPDAGERLAQFAAALAARGVDLPLAARCEAGFAFTAERVAQRLVVLVGALVPDDRMVAVAKDAAAAGVAPLDHHLCPPTTTCEGRAESLRYFVGKARIPWLPRFP